MLYIRIDVQSIIKRMLYLNGIEGALIVKRVSRWTKTFFYFYFRMNGGGVNDKYEIK